MPADPGRLPPFYLPLLAAGALVQIVVPSARIATSFEILGRDLPLATIGFLSSAFAILPIVLSLAIGRANDQGAVRWTLIGGAGAVLAAVCGLWAFKGDIVALFAFTMLLGLGQAMALTSQQMIVTLISPESERDRAFGHLMMALSIGQVLAPLLLTLVTGGRSETPPAEISARLLGVCVLVAGVLLVLSIGIARGIGPVSAAPAGARRGLGAILSDKGVLVVIVAGGLCVVASDLILVYLPALAAERGIDLLWVGVLLGVRAGGAIVSRFLFARLVRRVGRGALFFSAMLAAGAAILLIAFPLPLGFAVLAMALAGLGLGLAQVCSLTTMLALVASAMHGTAISLRFSANRLALLVIPFCSSLVIGAVGTGGVFAATGLALALSALGLRGRGLARKG